MVSFCLHRFVTVFCEVVDIIIFATMHMSFVYIYIFRERERISSKKDLYKFMLKVLSTPLCKYDLSSSCFFIVFL